MREEAPGEPGLLRRTGATVASVFDDTKPATTRARAAGLTIVGIAGLTGGVIGGVDLGTMLVNADPALMHTLVPYLNDAAQPAMVAGGIGAMVWVTCPDTYSRKDGQELYKAIHPWMKRITVGGVVLTAAAATVAAGCDGASLLGAGSGGAGHGFLEVAASLGGITAVSAGMTRLWLPDKANRPAKPQPQLGE